MTRKTLLAWLSFKAAIGIAMPLAVLERLPPPLNGRLDRNVLIAWAVLTMSGTIISVSGMILTRRRKHDKAAVMGVTIELAGLVFMFAGPAILLLSYGFLAFSGSSPQWVAVTLCWGLCSAIAVRFAMVWPKFRAELTDPRKGWWQG